MPMEVNLFDNQPPQSDRDKRVTIDRIATGLLGDMAHHSNFMTSVEYEELVTEVMERCACSLGYMDKGRIEGSNELPLMENAQ